MSYFDILAAQWEVGLGMATSCLEDQIILSDFLIGCDSEDVASEVRRLYNRYSGMPKDDYRWNDFYFWSCREAINFSTGLNQSDFLYFADVSLRFTVFSVKLNGDGAGEVHYGHGATVRGAIAPSLNAFFGMVNRDVSMLYL